MKASVWLFVRRIGIPVFIVAVVISSVWMYYSRQYLYFSFTIPSVIAQQQGFYYGWYKMPVSVEVMTDTLPETKPFVRNIYFPADKTQYENLARKEVDWYTAILTEGTKIPVNSPEVMNRDASSGIRYMINLRCDDVCTLPMDFNSTSNIIQMNNDYYTITPALRDQLINYIKATYPIKKAV